MNKIAPSDKTSWTTWF